LIPLTPLVPSNAAKSENAAGCWTTSPTNGSTMINSQIGCVHACSFDSAHMP
jgi:hypothetical protein